MTQPQKCQCALVCVCVYVFVCVCLHAGEGLTDRDKRGFAEVPDLYLKYLFVSL